MSIAQPHNASFLKYYCDAPGPSVAPWGRELFRLAAPTLRSVFSLLSGNLTL